MKQTLINFALYFIRFLDVIITYYQLLKNAQVKKKLGGGARTVLWPYRIVGIENIKMSDYVSIGPGSTIYSTRAKLIIQEHVTIGPNLTVITGDHMRLEGRFVDTVSDNEKPVEYDQDVIIQSDVWIGCNVTILKGVIIGRGSTVAAGAVVTKSFPPYSIIGGVPAKIIGHTLSDEVIIRKHELSLYGKTK